MPTAFPQDPECHDFPVAGASLAVVSDTHGFVDPRIREALGGFDCVLHAGDIGSTQVLEQLGVGATPVIAVRGNNDIAHKWPEGETNALETLPWVARVRLPGGDIVVVHGHQIANPSIRHDRLREAFPDARLVLYGHSHHQCLDQRVSPWVANPGVGGKNRAFGGPGFLTVDTTAARWHVETHRFSPLGKQAAL